MIDQHPEPQHAGESNPTVGYCRKCGKSLTAETLRQAHGTIYCAEHVPAQAAASTPPPLNDPYPSPYASTPGATVSGAGAVPSPDISPGLAFMLGLIPGVGAIYNGQYGKGLIHALITGTLITFANQSDHAEPVFAMMLTAFFFYMAFEAYHTARKRRDGLPVDEFSSLLNLRGNTSMAGPLILIAIGLLFLLNNLDLIPIRQLVRWWPLGLILIGCYMLFARVSRGNSAPPAPPFSGEVRS